MSDIVMKKSCVDFWATHRNLLYLEQSLEHLSELHWGIIKDLR